MDANHVGRGNDFYPQSGLGAGRHKQRQFLASEFDAGGQCAEYLSISFDEYAGFGAIQRTALDGVGIQKFDAAGERLAADDGRKQKAHILNAAAGFKCHDAEVIFVQRGAGREHSKGSAE